MFSVCRQFYFSKVTFVALPSKYQRALHHESKHKIEKIKLREPFAVVAGNLPKTALNGEQAFNFLNDGSNCRDPIKSGRADYVPIFLSEIPLLFRRNIIKLDLALLNISPPDVNGYCSLGPSVDVTRAAIESAKHLVVTSGDAHVHISNFTSIIHGDMPCHFMNPRQMTEVEDKIGALIADNLIDDGATLQTG
ncbi:unnamed protein product [Schistosoma mattheei]|uniref:Uncharacterized protein n=1 Tax=Schistosoma mattheei TaxID=31246 RepID=A0A183PNY2_9TREM|nr:unnamed protein product [Schistosoma mattheei]